MDKDRNEMTERILNLTLEIIYLLTGEDYIIVKKPGGRRTPSNRLQVVEGFCRTRRNTLVPPPQSPIHEMDNDQKILELTKKITQLLSGEVSIRCEDVTVYFSMEEWEYLEGHKDLYEDITMEGHQSWRSQDGSTSENTPGGIHPPNLASKGISEDSGTMDGVLRAKRFKTCKSGTTERNFVRKNNGEPTSCQEDLADTDIYTPTGHTRFPSTPIKEEPVSGEEEDLTDTDDSAPTDDTQSMSTQIKEEPVSCEEGDITDNDIDTLTDHKQYISVHIKEEPVSCEEGDITDNDIDTLTDDTQYISVHIKEEPVSCDEENLTDTNVSTPTGHTQSTSTHVKEEPGDLITSGSVAPTEPTIAFTVLGHVKPDTGNQKHDDSKPSSKGLGKSKSSSVYSVHQRADTMEILYHCPSCHKGFSSNLDLARHQVIHTVDKLFICSLCGKSFTEMSFLVKHQVIHTDLKLCVCPVCGGCFYSETSLAKHQKGHSLPLFCSTCGKCFFEKSELEIHERKHTGERPYGCHICGKHFIAKSVLNKHLLMHAHMEVKPK